MATVPGTRARPNRGEIDARERGRSSHDPREQKPLIHTAQGAGFASDLDRAHGRIVHGRCRAATGAAQTGHLIRNSCHGQDAAPVEEERGRFGNAASCAKRHSSCDCWIAGEGVGERAPGRSRAGGFRRSRTLFAGQVARQPGSVGLRRLVLPALNLKAACEFAFPPASEGADFVVGGGDGHFAGDVPGTRHPGVLWLSFWLVIDVDVAWQ